MIMLKQFANFALMTMFLVSCKINTAPLDLDHPSPTNTFIVTETPSPSNSPVPSLAPTAFPTESFRFYSGALTLRAGQIFKLEAETASYQRLWMVDENNDIVYQTYSGRDLELSPNLQYGAYISNGDIWLLDVKSGNQSNLTETPDCYEDNAFSWSPDSTEVLYFGCPSGSRLRDLYVIDIFSRKSKNLTNTPDKNENLFIRWWEAQPNLIFFGFQVPQEYYTPAQCHTRDGVCLYYFASIDPEGANYKIIDNVSGIAFPPSLSPDGRVIAYDGGIYYNLESGIYHVNNPSDFGISPSVPVNADGPELVQPKWSPSGKQILWLGHVTPDNINGTGVYLFDLSSRTGKIIYSFNPCYYAVNAPSSQMWTGIHADWSYDERFLGVITDEWGEKSCEYILHIFDKDNKIVQRHTRVDIRSLVWSPNGDYLVFRRLLESNGHWITLATSSEDWQLHPLDIPIDATLINWSSLK
jgi:Tol biopolymer transport system component